MSCRNIHFRRRCIILYRCRPWSYRGIRWLYNRRNVCLVLSTRPGSTDCIAACQAILYPIMPQLDKQNVFLAHTNGTLSYCLDSPAGQPCRVRLSTVENCDPGTYQLDTGHSSCLEADEGHFVDGFGATEQVPCEVGSLKYHRSIKLSTIRPRTHSIFSRF